MAVSFKHAFTSAKADGLDSTLIQPSNWNAEHTLTMAAGKVLGRDASGAGAVQELPIVVDATGQSMIPPSGTTGSRPTAATGMFRFNTTTGKFEGFSSGWFSFPVENTSNSFTIGSIELGNATDTTITRVSAGLIAVEGRTVATLSGTQTWTGNQTFTGTNFTVAGVTGSINCTSTVATAGFNITSTSGQLQYTSGITATQITSKSTAVSCFSTCGRVIMNNALLAGGATVYMQVNCNVSERDTVSVSPLRSSYATVGSYRVTVESVGSGSFTVAVTNTTGGNLSENLTINFVITFGMP